MDALASILPDLNDVQGWMQTGGYFVLFGLLFACGLGLPLPEDIPLIIAGALVAKGQMNIWIASIAAWCGIIGGDCVLYHLGKKYGMNITRVPFVGKHVTRERIERVEKLFNQYGVGVVAVGRLFAGIRGAMVVCAGTIRYNFWKFLIADGLAALVSGGLWVALGYWVGTNLDEIGKYKNWIIGGTIAAAALFIAWYVWRKRRPERARQVGDKIVEVEAEIVEKVAGAADKIKHPAHADTPAHDPSR